MAVFSLGCRWKLNPRIHWGDHSSVGLCVIKPGGCNKPEDIGIVLESQVVLQELDNVAWATAMLFGLMYALNLNYPPELKYAFERLQELVMELEGNTLSKKYKSSKLHEWTFSLFTRQMCTNVFSSFSLFWYARIQRNMVGGKKCWSKLFFF